jgi:DNA-binding transcriptional ArsR family regulator
MYATRNTVRGVRVALIRSREAKRIALALYESGLPSSAVSLTLQEQFNIQAAPPTVAKWARDARISRPKGGKRFPLSGRTLKVAYEAGVSVSQLADQYRVSQSFVEKRLREAGTRMRPSGTVYGVLTKALLRELYWGRDMGAKQIAALIGCSRATVYYRLRVYRIQRKRKQHKRQPVLTSRPLS